MKQVLLGRTAIRSPRHPLIWLLVAILVLSLALLPLGLIGAVVGAGLAIVLPLINPVFGLFWVVLSVPVQDDLLLPGNRSYTQAAMLLAAGAWGLRVLAYPERPITKGRLLPLWVLLLWALLISTSFTPYSWVEGVKETLRWVEAFLVWWIAVNTLQRRWQVVGLTACLLLAPVAEALIGLVQFATGDGPPSFRISPDQIFVRAYGTIGQPNSFAGYLNMAWPLALALAVAATIALWRDRRSTTEERSKWARIGRWSLVVGLWLSAGVLCTALLVSFSRGGWLGAAIGFLGMALALGRRAARWTLGAIIVGAFVLTLGGASVLPPIIANRVTSITRNLNFFDASTVQVTPENFALVERMAQLQAGWRMFSAYPLTGVGPGNYTTAYRDFAVLPWYVSRGHAHNYYLNMAAEAGIVGLLAYLALLVGVCYQAMVTLRRVDSTFWRGAAIGCCGIIAATAGHELFEKLHALSMGVQLAAVWGLLAGIERLANRSREAE